MKATPGPVTLLMGTMGMLGVLLTGCTDNTGAIDQEGHNGYDRMACTNFAAMANDVRHNAITTDQANAVAQQLAATSQRGGDVRIRTAGGRLADAYRARDTAAVTVAIADFTAACAW